MYDISEGLTVIVRNISQLQIYGKLGSNEESRTEV